MEQINKLLYSILFSIQNLFYSKQQMHSLLFFIYIIISLFSFMLSKWIAFFLFSIFYINSMIKEDYKSASYFALLPIFTMAYSIYNKL